MTELMPSGKRSIRCRLGIHRWEAIADLASNVHNSGAGGYVGSPARCRRCGHCRGRVFR